MDIYSPRVKELSELILKHKQLYYYGKAQISDFDYDALETELKGLCENHPVLSMVGASLSGDKVAHKKKMLSLQKTYVLDELLEWKGEREIISTEKIDGSSCSLIYKNGKYNLAKTRGNGEFGENITSKVFFIPDVPHEINDSGIAELEIRGEVYCTEENFILLKNEMNSLGLETPSSLRNIVAGLLGRRENIDLARFLSFKAFECLEFDSIDTLKKDSDKLNYIESLGFQVPEFTIYSNNANERINETLDEIKQFMSNGNYLIDGIVFSYNDLRLHSQLGETAHHPRYKMAFKFAGDSKITKILAITYQVSRNGVLTPVAEVEPVELAGANIARVTLHNWGIVKAYNLKIGDEIEIERSGEVIPKFISVVRGNQGSLCVPVNCPSCGELTQEIEIRMFCVNEKCIGRNLEFTKYFVKSLGIDDLSTERLKEMYEKKLISSPVDLFKLKPSDLLEKLEGYKDTLADKIINSIQEKSNPSLLTFLVSLGLSGGGKNKCEKLLKSLKILTLDDLFALTPEKLVGVEGFAQKSAVSFLDSLTNSEDFVNDLVSVGVQVEKPLYSDDAGFLDGQNFCITGTLSRPRSEIQNWIKTHGGKVVSSVSSKTNYLVCNEESSSSKYKKAVNLSIKIITEEELFSNLI